MLPVPPPRGLARATIALLVADAAVAAVAVALDSHALSLVSRVETSPRSVSLAALQASDRNIALLGAASLIGTVATAALFITWMYKSVVFQEQTLQLGVGHSRGWAIGSWFVPFLNLRRPKNIVDALWRGPSLIVNDGLARSLKIVNMWWAAWIASKILAWLATTGDKATVSGYRSNVNTEIVSLVLSLAAAAFAIVVVRTITDLQAKAEGIAHTERFSEKAYLGQAPNPWQHIYPVPSDVLNRHRAPMAPPTGTPQWGAPPQQWGPPPQQWGDPAQQWPSPPQHPAVPPQQWAAPSAVPPAEPHIDGSVDRPLHP